LQRLIELAQYTSAQFSGLADDLGVRLSVGRKGQCWDNAVAESFFASIKAKLIDRRGWPTRVAAHTAIFEYIEGWYTTPAGCIPASATSALATTKPLTG
jgi:putative transposase